MQLVQGVLALLALTHPPPVDGRGHLGDLVAVGDDADQQLGRLVLRLGELDGAGDLGTHGPQPERRVADPLPGQQADRAGEEPDPGAPDHVLGLLAAELPGAGHEVRLAGHHGRQHGRHLGRVVLAVRVGGDDVGGAALPGDPVAEPQRGALAAVDRHVGDHGAGLRRLGRGAVGAAVGDHDGGRDQPAHLGGQGLDDRPDGPGLVVGRDHDRDRREAGHALAVGVDQRLDGGVVDHLIPRVLINLACASIGSKSGQTVAMPVSRS